jgi:HPt (histidine-containing phosphotransfer) domain-containing protein
MTNREATIEELMAAARADFASRLGAKLGELRAFSSQAKWSDARRAAHRLRGSAATYGFPAIGAAAGAMEDALKSSGESPDEEAREGFASALASAERAIESMGGVR